MKHTGFWIFVALVTGSLCAASAAAIAEEVAATDSLAEPPIAWSATYASRYSFQGLDYSAGRPVLQPQVSGTLRGFTLTAWGNMDQTRREIDEIDLSLEREWTLPRTTVSLGYEHLRYPHRDWTPTNELIADLAVEAPLEPSLSVHWDFAAGTGRYWGLGVNRPIPWSRGMVTLATELYYQDHYYGMSGIPALETTLSAATHWGNLSVQPTLSRQWTWPNGDFRDDLAVHGGWVVGLQFASR
jgi:hypothetical protein